MTETPIFEALCADFAVRGIDYAYLATPTAVRRKGVRISKAANGMIPVGAIVDECELTVPMPQVTDWLLDSLSKEFSATDPALIQFANRAEYQVTSKPFHISEERLERARSLVLSDTDLFSNDEDTHIQE